MNLGFCNRLFLFIIGGAIFVLNDTGTIAALIHSIVLKYGCRKYFLMGVIVFVFMFLGAFIGIFEEVVPLVPFIIQLSKQLGWDELTGLGMSTLASGFGFAAAVFNPFTIGVAQKLADIPIFSGAVYRLLIFILVYTILYLFLFNYSKSLKANNENQEKITNIVHITDKQNNSVKWFIVVTIIMLCIIMFSPVIEFISKYNLIIISVFFLIIGLGAGIISGFSVKKTLSTYIKGSISMLPGVILILLASSVKFIISTGGIMDTILYYFSQRIVGLSPIGALPIIYLLVLCLNFFIGSGSAKAFLIIPIITPLLDIVNLSRQLSILSFQFGDGFSNVFYPTNMVLIMSLSFANVSYIKWVKWTFKLQLFVLFITVILLWFGLFFGY